MSNTYNPSKSETKWYDYWMKNQYFESTPDKREAYTIVIPPPNVTGVLHMGHMLNNTLQDVLVRKARMQGYNACWVPGTDHASIATEAKVVDKLKKEGFSKSDLTRQEFIEKAWEWTAEHGGIIMEQLKKIGCSCAWGRAKFTLDDDLYESVIDVFIDLFNKGLIYRGYRMVNWDPKAKTTISNEEVIYIEKQGKLYYLKYFIEDSHEFLLVATTRPETIFGDSAVCIHPKDERYSHLKGKRVIVPIVNRPVPIIEDHYVDQEFGTGCLKITPAHDPNDYEIGKRHSLGSISIFNKDATLNECGMHYKGLDRFEVRKKIVTELQENDLLHKSEEYQTKVGTSERTGEMIEPKLSMQWFLSMKELVKPAIEAVRKKDIKIVPAKYINTYMHWMEQARDWNISRQLYWGHRIPAYFYGSGQDDFVVAKSNQEATRLAKIKSGNSKLSECDLKQDPGVLDTWFSSWLWPISVFDGIRNPDNKDIKYYYPTNDLVTGPDILFFWVARMIIYGYEYRNEKPFSTVYLTGIVRDKMGRKMSKSLGNSPDPIQLVDQYGADAVRVGMLLTSPAGNDLPFDKDLCKQGKNFANKIWNASRLVQGWKVEVKPAEKHSECAVLWFEERSNEVIEQVEQLFSQYRISEVLMLVYRYVWDDFCSWYLEAIKPAFGDTIDTKTHDKTVCFLEIVLKLLHPFLPFLTEDLWQSLKKRTNKEAIIISDWPKTSKPINRDILDEFNRATHGITALRNLRKKKNISPKTPLSVQLKSNRKEFPFSCLLEKLAHIESIELIDEKPQKGFSILVGLDEYFVSAYQEIDRPKEIISLQNDLIYLEGFLKSVQKKLNNKQFIANAPEKIVIKEQQKEKDALKKIQLVKDQIKQLN